MQQSFEKRIRTTFKTVFSNRQFKHKHIFLLGVLCLFIVVLQAQIRPKQLRKEVNQSQNPSVKQTGKAAKGKSARKNGKKQPDFKPVAPIMNPLSNKKATLVYLENSESLSFDKITNPDVQVLKGNVRFRHDNAVMYCDSAYFYEKANSLDAFGNVRIVQGDTLFVYGDFLFYDGNRKLARLRRNVRLVNRKTTLTTDSLNYDRMADLTYYYTGGKIKDQLNTLTSVWGQYSPVTNEALFKNTVHLLNKDFTMDADTLKYNTNTKIANIVGKTHILYKGETDIYSSRGWYNTFTQRSMLLDRSTVLHKGGKTLTGDTIYYDKKQNYGEAFVNVLLNDTVQKSTLYGDYIYYNNDKEMGLATDSALLEDWSTKDTMFVHADTLRTSKDSIYDLVRGYYHVRLFRNDVQGLCDSLSYSARDSVMHMFGEPVIWAENNQLSGEYIRAFTKNQKVDYIHIQRAAVAIQQQDSVHYNQLSGKEMIAHMDSGQVKKVDVNGNAETIYYPVDDKDSTLIGINKTQSSFVVMYMKNKKVERIVLTAASSGTMYPIAQLSGKDLYLKNFFWLPEQRPKNKQDLFTVFPKTERPKPGIERPKSNEDSKKKGVKPKKEEKILSSENTENNSPKVIKPIDSSTNKKPKE